MGNFGINLQNTGKSVTEKQGDIPDSDAVLTDKSLNYGLWYIENFPFIKKILFILVIAVAVGSWGYTILNLIWYAAVGMKEDAKLQAELLRPIYIGHEYFEQNKPQNLNVYSVSVFEGHDGNYDFAVEIDNPNKKFQASFQYVIKGGGAVVYRGRDFILPDESKYLVVLSQKTLNPDQEFDLEIESISWRRFDQKKIRDWSSYRAQHLDFEIDGAEFIPNSSVLSQKVRLNTVKFTARNNSPFNYESVKFLIFIKSNDSIIGVQSYILDNFLSSRSYPVELRWQGSIDYAASVEVVPDINILDESIYLPLEGDSGYYDRMN